MNKYSVQFRDGRAILVAGRCVLSYDSRGILLSVVVEMQLSEDQANWFWSAFLPVLESEVMQIRNKQVLISPILVKLSFVDFWNAYAYKVGNKGKCEKFWHGLNDVDRTKCFNSIVKYKQHIAMHNIDTLYPERYLSQRRFDNEYK